MKLKLSLITAMLAVCVLASHAATANDLVAQGRSYLAQRNLLAANNCFSNAVVQAPNDPTANVFRAVTRVLSFPNQAAGSNFLNRIGMSKSGRDVFNWTATMAVNSNGETAVPSVNANEATALLRNSLIPELDAAETGLAKVTDKSFTIVLTASETGGNDVTVDYGDVQVLRAGLGLAKLWCYTTYSWNLDAQLSSVSKLASADTGSLERVLTNFPKLLTCATTADMTTGKQTFTSAVDRYMTASELVRSRTGETTCLFNFDTTMSEREEKLRQTLVDLTNSLAGPVVLSLNTNYTVNAGQVFKGTSPRSWFPTIHNNGFIWGSLPDPTFSGIITGLSGSTVEHALAQNINPLLRVPGVSATKVCSISSDYYSHMMQTADGTMFVISQYGGTPDENGEGSGIIYKVQPTGTQSVFARFGGAKGSCPTSLVEGNDGNLYGATSWGGDYDNGTIFKLTRAGTLTTLVSLDWSVGSGPLLLKGKDGMLYGVTTWGGGTLFQVSTTGDVALLGNFSVGDYYFDGTLITGTDGAFYGTVNNWSDTQQVVLIFKITTSGEVSYVGNEIPGESYSDLAQDADGSIYCAVQDSQSVFDPETGWYDYLPGNLKIFKVTPSGETTLFCAIDQDFAPRYPAGLTLDQDGNLLVISEDGGGSDMGAIIKVTQSGQVTPLVWFEGENGAFPHSSLLPGKDGSFYGLTSGGQNDLGTMYKLTMKSVPTIAQHPSSTTNLAGTTASFCVSAGGAGTLTYHWQKNGANLANNSRITGATSATLSIQNVTAADAGSYSVIVDNGQGSVSSISAVLSVVVPDTVKPTLAIVPAATSIRVSNEVYTIAGTARDNVAVNTVRYQLNGSDWTAAQTGNAWSNWNAVLSLVPGTNIIRVSAVDTSGNISTTNSVTVFRILTAPITIQANGSGSVTSITNRQPLVIGSIYTLTAKPAIGFVFSNWTGSVSSESSAISFKMAADTVVIANFIPDPFKNWAGVYNGLFYNATAVEQRSAGAFTVTVRRDGTYTAKIIQGTASYGCSSKFNVAGKATNTLSLSKTNKVTIEMELSPEIAGLSGTVRNTEWTAELSAFRSPYSSTSPAPQAGKYTVVIPGSNELNADPSGFGFGAITVDPLGNVSMTGQAADGSTILQKTTVSQWGDWPFYTATSERGALFGWLSFRPGGSTDVAGNIDWIKPANGKKYPLGFDYHTNVIGSTYTNKPTLLGYTNGAVEFSDGNLTAPVTNPILLKTNNTVIDTFKTNKLTLTLTPASGLFKGNVTINKKVVPFNGVVLQKEGVAYGAFQGTTNSGAVVIQKN